MFSSFFFKVEDEVLDWCFRHCWDSGAGAAAGFWSNKFNFILPDSQLYLHHRWHLRARVLLQCRDKGDEVSLYKTGFGPKTNFFRISGILPTIELESLGSSGRRRRIPESVFKTERVEHDSSLDRRASLWEMSGRGLHLLRRFQQFCSLILI